jgi:threonyl-tRNA synthetase
MLVIGEKEVNENKIAVRRQGKGDEGVKDVDEFVAELREEIRERRS